MSSSSRPSANTSSRRWARAQELFEQILNLPAGERESWLEKRCDDREVRALVLTMVRSDATQQEFLENPLMRLRAEGESSSSGPCSSGPLATGQRLGPYRILEPLGEGGMSTVYRAERADQAFELQVVVKVVRHGLETAENLRRLKAERRILAELEHPDIARLYDGGTTPEQLPYFVMELVPGEPIDAFCDARRLTLRQRIELFVKVCGAVGYAHRRLVVHRDLKPANLLVTPAGQPKLLDFGIAKILQDQGLEEPARTSAFLRRLTPDYASPEQIRGEPITTATDVYSLGVMLYLLLTGRLPRNLGEGRWRDLERAAGEEVKPPSAVAEKYLRAGAGEEAARARGARPEVWRRQLHGDLDAIALRALAPEPEERYPSVAELSRDLERYLQGLPVEARTPSVPYRLGKFLRRHRGGALAAAALTLLGAVTLGNYIHHARVTAFQRDELEAVVAAVTGLLDVAGEGEHLTARQIVDRSSAMVETTIAGRPELEGTLRQTMGSIYLNLGVPERAREQLERAYLLDRRLHGAGSLEAAGSQSSLGLARARADDLEAAEEAARRALEIARRVHGEGSPELVGFLNNLVTVLCYRGDFEAAEPLSAEGAALAARLPDPRLEKAKAFANRGFLLGEVGERGEAAGLYGRALELHRRHRGEEHPEVLGVMNNLSLLLGDLGRHGESEAILRQTLALQRKLLGAENPEVVRTLNNLAGSLRDQGSLAAAAQAQEEAVALADRVLPPGHFAELLTRTRLAEIRLENGQATAAAEIMEEGLERWRRSLPESWFLAHAESVLGAARAGQKRWAEAETLLEQGYRSLKEIRGAGFHRTEAARRRLESFYASRGRPEEVPSEKISSR